MSGVEQTAKPLLASQKRLLQALAMTEVPLDAFPVSHLPAKVTRVRERPQRRRMPPLEHWRNERVVYERPRGSRTPEIAGVALNMAPRPALERPRRLGCHVLKAPPPWRERAESVTEFVGLSTAELTSRIFTLRMPQRAGQRPPTVRLPPALGQIFVLDGGVRCTYEGDPAGTELRLLAGDTALLRDEGRAVLAAPAELGGDEELAGGGGFARFFWVQVAAAGEPERPPASAARSAGPGLKDERPSPRTAPSRPLPPATPFEL